MLVETALQRYLQDGTLESAQSMNDELREATIDTVRCIARNINQSSPNANIAFIGLVAADDWEPEGHMSMS